MFIIFNLAFLLWVLISSTIALIIQPLWSAQSFEDVFMSLFMLIGVPFGAFMELTKFKPRLFFIPSWMIALAILCFLAWEAPAWIRTISFLGIFATIQISIAVIRPGLQGKLRIGNYSLQ